MITMWKRVQSVRHTQERNALIELRIATDARDKVVTSIADIEDERAQLDLWRQSLLNSNSAAYLQGIVDQLTLRATSTHLNYLDEIELALLLRRLDAEIALADANAARDSAQNLYRQILAKRTRVDEVISDMRKEQNRLQDLREEDQGNELFNNRVHAEQSS